MMESIVNLIIFTLAILGGLYALGLIIVAIVGPPTIDDTECHCKACNK